jgi:hypothetical protein
MPSLSGLAMIHSGRLTARLESRALSRPESFFVLAGGDGVAESKHILSRFYIRSEEVIHATHHLSALQT